MKLNIQIKKFVFFSLTLLTFKVRSNFPEVIEKQYKTKS